MVRGLSVGPAAGLLPGRKRSKPCGIVPPSRAPFLVGRAIVPAAALLDGSFTLDAIPKKLGSIPPSPPQERPSEVRRMPPQDACAGDMLVWIRCQGAVDPNEATAEAIGDWHYCVAQGYLFCPQQPAPTIKSDQIHGQTPEISTDVDGC
jgi:hypothetical protein